MSSPARRRRRQAEQDAFESVYLLGGPDAAQDWCDQGIETKQLVTATSYAQARRRRRMGAPITEAVQRYRCYRCPRCGGGGYDPELPLHYDSTTSPPDPCGFCDGRGVIEPHHYRVAQMHEHARGWQPAGSLQ